MCGSLTVRLRVERFKILSNWIIYRVHHLKRAEKLFIIGVIRLLHFALFYFWTNQRMNLRLQIIVEHEWLLESRSEQSAKSHHAPNLNEQPLSHRQIFSQLEDLLLVIFDVFELRHWRLQLLQFCAVFIDAPVKHGRDTQPSHLLLTDGVQILPRLLQVFNCFEIRVGVEFARLAKRKSGI